MPIPFLFSEIHELTSHISSPPPPVEELAQAIMNRMRNPGSAADQEAVIRRLDEFLIHSRSEAMVIQLCI